MPSSVRNVAAFVLVALLMCAIAPSEASAARRRARSRQSCNQTVSCTTAMCVPCKPPCICIIQPYFYLPYTVLHYANQHPSCSLADCPNVTPVTYANASALPGGEDCIEGNCSIGMTKRNPKSVDRPFLDIPEYPYDPMGDVTPPANPNDPIASWFNFCPGDKQIYTTTGELTTPKGNKLIVQVFIFEIGLPITSIDAVGSPPRKVTLAFGVEIQNLVGPAPPIEFRAKATPYDSHNYLYEFMNGSVKYLALGSKE